MLSSPQKMLIILLTLLQLVAPLVHAHTGEEHATQNIHLPGFEFFNLTLDTAILQAQKHPNFDTGSIISIGSAIKHKKIFSDHTVCYSLPADNFSISAVTHHSAFKYTPRQQISLPATHYSSLPVRAPPLKL